MESPAKVKETYWSHNREHIGWWRVPCARYISGSAGNCHDTPTHGWRIHHPPRPFTSPTHRQFPTHGGCLQVHLMRRGQNLCPATMGSFFVPCPVTVPGAWAVDRPVLPAAETREGNPTFAAQVPRKEHHQRSVLRMLKSGGIRQRYAHAIAGAEGQTRPPNAHRWCPSNVRT